jgi:hypothetical protein
MKKNLGTTDRVVRFALAVAAGGAAYFSEPTAVRIVLAALSLFTFYEAVAGWCALYALVGKNTCPLPSVHDHEQ